MRVSAVVWSLVVLLSYAFRCVGVVSLACVNARRRVALRQKGTTASLATWTDVHADVVVVCRVLLIVCCCPRCSVLFLSLLRCLCCCDCKQAKQRRKRDGEKESGGAEFYAFNAESREVSTMLARGVKRKSSKHNKNQTKKGGEEKETLRERERDKGKQN